MEFYHGSYLFWRRRWWRRWKPLYSSGFYADSDPDASGYDKRASYNERSAASASSSDESGTASSSNKSGTAASSSDESGTAASSSEHDDVNCTQAVYFFGCTTG